MDFIFEKKRKMGSKKRRIDAAVKRWLKSKAKRDKVTP